MRLKIKLRFSDNPKAMDEKLIIPTRLRNLREQLNLE
jgi:hypothetical protein